MYGLDERLSLCASFVRNGAAVADIGTDHGYIPVKLALAGKIKCAAACDVRKGPLENAKQNIEKNGVGHIVRTVLSDGLDELCENDADDIIIAGMGAELIVKIISRAEWLKNNCKNLILQPMTKPEILRRYLCSEGFAIIDEKPCISLGKVYSVMLCRYDGIIRECDDEYSYIGRIGEIDSPQARRYIYFINEKLKKRLRGYCEGTADHERLKALTEKFSRMSEDFDV